jgi:hypothetical protein
MRCEKHKGTILPYNTGSPPEVGQTALCYSFAGDAQGQSSQITTVYESTQGAFALYLLLPVCGNPQAGIG